MTYKSLDAQLSKLKLLHRFEAGVWNNSSPLSEEGLLSVTATRCFLAVRVLYQYLLGFEL